LFKIFDGVKYENTYGEVYCLWIKIIGCGYDNSQGWNEYLDVNCELCPYNVLSILWFQVGHGSWNVAGQGTLFMYFLLSEFHRVLFFIKIDNVFVWVVSFVEKSRNEEFGPLNFCLKFFRYYGVEKDSRVPAKLHVIFDSWSWIENCL